jgi:hypothetical protein
MDMHGNMDMDTHVDDDVPASESRRGARELVNG